MSILRGKLADDLEGSDGDEASVKDATPVVDTKKLAAELEKKTVRKFEESEDIVKMRARMDAARASVAQAANAAPQKNPLVAFQALNSAHGKIKQSVVDISGKFLLNFSEGLNPKLTAAAEDIADRLELLELNMHQFGGLLTNMHASL